MNTSHTNQPQITIGNHLTIEAELSALQSHVAGYRRALNDEAVWLFLATLGCWSVTNGMIQFVALGLAVLLFGSRMANRSIDSRSYSKLVKTIEHRIEQIVPAEDSRKARLFDLAAFQRSEMSTLRTLKSSWPFLLCWLFFGATLLYTVLHIAPKSAG